MKIYLLILLCFSCLATSLLGQCPPGTISAGTNLVVNGDFSAGNTGFSSGYTYGTGGSFGLVSTAGQYAIVTSPDMAHTNFAAFGDHTTGSGNLMVVNGSGVANVNLWCQNVSVNPNTYYTFSTWISSANSVSPAVLQFSINGANLGTPFNISSVTGLWQQFFITWYSGVNTNANICIVNQNTSTIGNDFAIDDISFVECECNLIIDAGPDTTVCEGSAVQLFASGGDSYQWYPFTGLTDSAIANPVAMVTNNITYYAIISNAAGCIDTSSVTINVIPQQQISAGIDDSICFGDSIQLNGTGNGIVSWSPTTGLSSPDILNPVAFPTQTTDYILTITDGPCVYYDTVTIFIKQLPQLDAGINDSVCIGSSIQLNGNGNGIASWSPTSGLNNPNILNPVATPAQTTKYYLTIQSNGCQNTDSVTIIVKPLPQVNAGPDKEICPGESIQLNASGNGIVTWSPSTGLSNSAIINPIASPSQTTTYILNILANGCENKDTVVVSVKSLPQVNAGINDSICFGESIQLNGNGSGTVLWTPSTNLNNNSVLNPVASPLQTTSYILQIDSGGCTNSDTVTIFVKQLPNVSAGIDDTICAGESIQLNGSGTGNVSWLPAQSLSNSLILNPVATPGSTTVYVLTIEENGCYNKDSVAIFVKQLPLVNAGVDTNICEGFSIQLNGTGTGIVSWLPDSGMSNPAILNPVVSPDQTTIYTLTVLSNGCENSDSVKITVIPLPDVDAGEDGIVCFGESIQLSASGASSYTWSPTFNLFNENTANPVATPLETTEYIVTGILNGCTNYDTIEVVVASLPVVNAGNDTVVPKETNYTLNGFPSGGNWSSDDGMLCSSCTNYNMVITKDQPFYYHYIDSNGCENTDTVFIYLNRTCKDPYFPTAFSPNEDFINDTFLPVFEDIHVVLEVEFIIYNKWGEQVFYTNKINEGWDGKTKNLPQMIGVYAYVYKYGCETDSKVIKGLFTLVR